MATGEKRRFRVLLTDTFGDLVDGHWETEERLREPPAAGVILYVRDGAGGDRRIRACVREIDNSSPLAIIARVEPLH